MYSKINNQGFALGLFPACQTVANPLPWIAYDFVS